MNTAMTTQNLGENRPEVAPPTEGEVVSVGNGEIFISVFNYSEIRFVIYKDYIIFSMKAESFTRKDGKTMEATVSVAGNDILVRDDVSSLQISIRYKNNASIKRIEKFEGNALVVEFTGTVNVKQRKEEVYHHEVVRIFIEVSDLA